MAANTPKGVAVVGKDLDTARILFTYETSLPRQDCDAVGDGRWICASYSNPEIDDLVTGSTGRYSGLPVAVVGNTLTIAHKNFSDATILERIDCDPAGSAWVCASFNNPVFDDVMGLSPLELNDIKQFQEQTSPSKLFQEQTLPSAFNLTTAVERMYVAHNNQLGADTLYKSGDLLVLNYDSCPDPDDLHAAVAGKMVLDHYDLKQGTDYIVSNGTCGDLRSRDDFIDNSYLIFNHLYGNRWHDVFNNETASLIAVADALAERLNTGAKVWVLDGGPMDFTARVVRQLEATGYASNLANITVIQHSHGWNEDNTDPDNLRYMSQRVAYKKIDNGNFANNNTAQLNQRNDMTTIPDIDSALVQRFLDDPVFGDYWETAFDMFAPTRRFDGSDTVELLWVLGLNSDYVADWYDFADMFLTAESLALSEIPLNNANGTILFADYESGGLNSGVAGLQALSPPADDAITMSSIISRSGQFSVNHRIQKSDDYVSAGAWRAESNSIDLRKSRYDQGDYTRYQFSIYLPTSWKIDNKNSIDAIWQWKRFSSRPDMFVLIRGADIELRLLSGGRRTVLKNYRLGEWIDLQFDVSHSAGGDGSVAMYYKYANQSDYILADYYEGATMLNDGPIDSTYLKWGLYKPDFDLSSYPTTERSIYHDDIKVLELN